MVACSVIEYAVALCNDPHQLSDSMNVYDFALLGTNPKKCMIMLGLFFNTSVNNARAIFELSFQEDVVSSKKITSIVRASVSLLKLRGHAPVCAEALTNSGCVEASLSALEDDSGLQKNAKDAVAFLLSSLMDSGNEKARQILKSRAKGESRECWPKGCNKSDDAGRSPSNSSGSTMDSDGSFARRMLSPVDEALDGASDGSAEDQTEERWHSIDVPEQPPTIDVPSDGPE